MKLNESDLQEIREFIINFRKLHEDCRVLTDDIKDLELKIKSAVERKDEFLRLIDEARKSEDDFMRRLRDKYGPGKLSIDKWEWVDEHNQ